MIKHYYHFKISITRLASLIIIPVAVPAPKGRVGGDFYSAPSISIRSVSANSSRNALAT
ncbi:MAG: Uncharacterised protein [SAR116 cluster bacterium MED-G04]|nr:MAG: Uncharacterised protein [SAR116 cluster bacterium MED-G04]